MTKNTPVCSRRRAIGLLFVSPVPLFLASPAFAFTDHEWEMRQSLAGMTLPVRPASLDLIRFSLEVRNDRFQMAAVVRMTWPPGMRQCCFTAEQDDPDQALADLLDDIQARFASAA